ncbi:hypothetical protein I553_2383 [Mycobacterium xenopi 4042]|uniref:Uncharacterized protein n=1 Tax=Mycobacterium xenopi 4042 TaxID=1299334 RepID=X8C764_MYCXE|nr:hypothetical protein I553_2383 [Mycobacterium xenopi 4042]
MECPVDSVVALVAVCRRLRHGEGIPASMSSSRPRRCHRPCCHRRCGPAAKPPPVSRPGL